MRLALLVCLPGTIFLFQGEELRDPYRITFWPDYKGRDGYRSPMPWRHDASEAGFTDHTPFLPVPQAHRHRAVASGGRSRRLVAAVREAFANLAEIKVALQSTRATFLRAAEPLLAYTRASADQHLQRAFNLSSSAVEAVLPLAAQTAGGSVGSLLTESVSLHLPPYGALFWPAIVGVSPFTRTGAVPRS